MAVDNSTEADCMTSSKSVDGKQAHNMIEEVE
jgi:hypothetical protein